MQFSYLYLNILLIITQLLMVAKSDSWHFNRSSMQQALDAYALGIWKNNKNPKVWCINNSSSSNTNPLKYNFKTFSTKEARKCLHNKWIFIIGDSTMRMFFSRIVDLVNGTLVDPRFGSYKTHHKGGCQGAVTDYEGRTTNQCLREYVKSRFRITFSFQTNGQHNNSMFDSLVSESHLPDLVLLTTGSWDVGYGGLNAKDPIVANHSVQMVRNIRTKYSGPIVWLITNACEPFRNSSIDLGIAQRSAMETKVIMNVYTVRMYYLKRLLNNSQFHFLNVSIII